MIGLVPVPIALQLYSVRDLAKQDLPGTLRAVAAAGYEAVEPYSLHGLRAGGFRAELDGAGLRTCSWHVPLDRIEADPGGIATAAGQLGSDRVVVPWLAPATTPEEADAVA